MILPTVKGLVVKFHFSSIYVYVYIYAEKERRGKIETAVWFSGNQKNHPEFRALPLLLRLKGGMYASIEPTGAICLLVVFKNLNASPWFRTRDSATGTLHFVTTPNSKFDSNLKCSIFFLPLSYSFSFFLGTRIFISVYIFDLQELIYACKLIWKCMYNLIFWKYMMVKVIIISN